MAAPVVQNQCPADSATLVAPHQPVYLEITDADADLVAASVIIWHNGRVAWTGDAAQLGFAITKTVIVNGFSYSIVPAILPERGSVVQIEVYAEDAIPNNVSEAYNYGIGAREYVHRFDDFDDTSLHPDLVIVPGNGTITEPAGTELKLDCPNSVQCDWWVGINNAPYAYFPLPSWLKEGVQGLLQIEVKLNDVVESAVNISLGGGPLLFKDDPNAYHSAFYPYLADIRFERIGSSLYNSADGQTPPSTTPHLYRMIWNDSGSTQLLFDGSTIENREITFFWSTDGGASWTRAYTETINFPPKEATGFGVLHKKWGTGGTHNSQAYVDYLELRELLPADELDVGQDVRLDEASVEDSTAFPSQGGPPTYQDGIGGAQRMPGPATQQPGSQGPFDDVQVDDEVSYTLGGLTDYRMDTNDLNGHPHFISERITKALIYDAAGEAGLWTTPTDPSFTGYGKDGKYYVAGVDQASFAPWYDEAESDDRGPTKPFPDKVLICVGQNGSDKTNKEIVIFDLDSFPTTLNVWMRFKFNAGNNAYFAMGNESKQVTSIAMANGVLVMGSIPGSDRAYLHLMDFKGVGQDCAYMLNASDDWLAASGKTLADRNTHPFWTTTGGLGYRTDEEYIYSVTAHLDTDGQLWVACAGEDPGPNLYRINMLNPRPNRRIQVTGDVGDADIGDKRKTAFDEDGNWWFSIEKCLHRIVPIDYQDGYAYLDLSVQNRRRGGADEWVELPYEVLNFAAVGDYLFVGTEVGVYRVHRGSMTYALAYTIVGGGGGGTNDTPPDGELIPGDAPEILWLTGHALHSAHYLHLSTQQGVATIRTLDDVAVDSRLFPDLDEPGAHFNVAVVD